jgi:hypothetical protein
MIDRVAGSQAGQLSVASAALSHFIRFVTASSSAKRILRAVNASPVHT